MRKKFKGLKEDMSIDSRLAVNRSCQQYAAASSQAGCEDCGKWYNELVREEKELMRIQKKQQEAEDGTVCNS
jgi:hypothetical protein